MPLGFNRQAKGFLIIEVCLLFGGVLLIYNESDPNDRIAHATSHNNSSNGALQMTAAGHQTESGLRLKQTSALAENKRLQYRQFLGALLEELRIDEKKRSVIIANRIGKASTDLFVFVPCLPESSRESILNRLVEKSTELGFADSVNLDYTEFSELQYIRDMIEFKSAHPESKPYRKRIIHLSVPIDAMKSSSYILSQSDEITWGSDKMGILTITTLGDSNTRRISAEIGKVRFAHLFRVED